MGSSMRTIAIAGLAAASLLAAPAAYAQSPSPSPSPGVATSAKDIPEHKVDQAAKAIGRVNTLAKEYRQQIAAAPAADRERLTGEAETALMQAVEKEGLTVEEYNSIVEVAQSDPEFRNKIFQRMPQGTQ